MNNDEMVAKIMEQRKAVMDKFAAYQAKGDELSKAYDEHTKGFDVIKLELLELNVQLRKALEASK